MFLLDLTQIKTPQVIAGISYFIPKLSRERFEIIVWEINPALFLLSVDVDECLRPDVCGEGHCVNTVGAFRCRYCDSGHRMAPGGHCEGEYAARRGGCATSECRGGLTVQCRAGWRA